MDSATPSSTAPGFLAAPGLEVATNVFLFYDKEAGLELHELDGEATATRLGLPRVPSEAGMTGDVTGFTA